VTLTIPVHPELRRVIEATSSSHLTFLVTAYGKPHSKKAFGSKVREWCDQAGCPDISSHGLRKAIARRMAEATKSSQEIMAITGHRTLSEVERYTKDASQRKLAATAMDFATLSTDEKRT
jgi:integrase/recombinase XerD